MLSNSLKKAGAVEAREPVQLERAANYSKHMTIANVHGHPELNYRKAPAGFMAYSMKNMDPYVPFMWRSPLRHVDKTMSGTWFAAGHVAYKPGFSGPFNIKLWIRTTFCMATGFSLGVSTWYRRMSRNNWEWKNKGAVIGME